MAPLIAITSYYNPFRGERRRRNYHLFRRFLGVPLVTVEWAPDGAFDLGPDDADILLRLRGGDLLWQKETLLNHGLAIVRERALAQDVAILDADVVFAEADWAARVHAALDDADLVQCFSHADYLPESAAEPASREDLATLQAEFSLGSLAGQLSRGDNLFQLDPSASTLLSGHLVPPSGNPGLAFALRLATVPQFSLYDGNIVGGGDLVTSAACAGKLDELFTHRLYSPAHQDDIRRWAARHLPAQPRFSCADNRVLHLWHGTLEGRGFTRRTTLLPSRHYDPAQHLLRDGGALRLHPSADAIREAVAAYLASRDDA